MSSKKMTLTVFRIGFACAKYSSKPVPSTSEEMYDILNEVGVGIKPGMTVGEVEQRLDAFLKSKNYDRAMKIV